MFPHEIVKHAAVMSALRGLTQRIGRINPKWADAYRANKAMWGPGGYGQFNSLSQVTRRNPNLRHLGSWEGSLPGASQGAGRPVVDAFVPRGFTRFQVEGRKAAPVVFRQRNHLGFDQAGKGVWQSREARFQPVYQSSGNGERFMARNMGYGQVASSGGRWVPFDKIYAGNAQETALRQLHATTPGLSRMLPIAPPGGPVSPNNWVGKNVRMVDRRGNDYWEHLSHPDDIARGYGRWHKNQLPSHLEALQQFMNRWRG